MTWYHAPSNKIRNGLAMRYIPRFVRLIVGWVMAGFFMLVFGVGRGEDGRYCSAIYGVKVSSFGEKNLYG